MISSLGEIFVRYGSLLSAILFCVFFAAAFVALVFRDHEAVRRTYVAFVVLLVLGSSLTGLQSAPIINAREYSVVSSDRYVHYDLRVAGADGEELPYDPRAMRPAIQNEELAENMGKVGVGSEKTDIAYTPAERRAVAAFLLQSAREYRHRVEAGWNPLSLLKFPPHHLRGHWTADELDGFATFVAIRVYRVEVTFADGGRRAVVEEEKLVYEYREGGDEST